MKLSERLGMTRDELLVRMSSTELMERLALDRLEAAEAEAARQRAERQRKLRGHRG